MRKKKLSSQHTLTRVPAGTWVMFALSLQQIFYAFLTLVNTNFSSTSYRSAYISKNYLFLLKSPDRLSIPFAVTRLRH